MQIDPLVGRQVLEANGFRLAIDPEALVGQRAKVVAVPSVRPPSLSLSLSRVPDVNALFFLRDPQKCVSKN